MLLLRDFQDGIYSKAEQQGIKDKVKDITIEFGKVGEKQME